MAIKKKKAKNPVGAPSFKYDKKIGDEVCDIVSTTTKSLQRILQEMPHLPSIKTITKWRIKIPEFGFQYTQAKCSQAELLAEELLDIADDSSRDTYKDEDGNEHCDKEWVARSRLRLDTRKWILCKLLPKIYGDKLQIVDNSEEKKQIADAREVAKKCMPKT